MKKREETDRRCEMCVWWNPQGDSIAAIYGTSDYEEDPESCEFDDEAGECRRYPPRGNDSVEGHREWPLTEKSEWCGEFAWSSKRRLQHLSADEQALLEKPISELTLPVRVRSCLHHLKIFTVAELLRHTTDDLLECDNFGVTSLNQLQDELANYGLKMPDWDPVTAQEIAYKNLADAAATLRKVQMRIGKDALVDDEEA